ncbi:MAG: DUF3488 and transglutaminase-like domain-containing protein [Acidobacteriota bacterium]|nr:DUF3488 and transglutaminase-like domain-containing protein [Acidobacteriota bacterium]
MTFRHQKRMLLGSLALLAPLPLPFNEVVGWAEVAAYSMAVCLFLFRTESGKYDVLPNWVLNVLGLAYLPFLILELRHVIFGQVLHSVVHLVLYTLSIKLFALRTEKDKWQVFLATFFLFVASMGSSVHPASLLYLAGFLGLAIHTLVRFAGFEILGRPGAPSRRHRPVPVRGFTTSTAVLVVVGAIPFFVLFPRLRQPYILGSVAVPGASTQSTGFDDSFGLNTIGRTVLGNRVALRYRHYGEPAPWSVPRFKAATYSRFDGSQWRRTSAHGGREDRRTDGFFHLVDERPRWWMDLWLPSQMGAGLVLPVETTFIAADAPFLFVAEDGVVSLPSEGGGTVAYRAGLGARAVLEPDRARAKREIELDPGGITPRIAELAAEVMGVGSAKERVERLEDYLRSDTFTYTLDVGNLSGEAPIERFLFESRRGYCEYFATSMILMLRSQGIPARLVAGFVGAERNSIEDYFIVRESNAHAWVEADVPGRGWTLLDPTPGVRGEVSTRSKGMSLLSQAYDYLVFRWDRYVLTYGFSDQVGLFTRFRTAWREWWRQFKPDGPDIETPQTRPQNTEPRVEPLENDLELEIDWLRLMPLGGLLGLFVLWLYFRRPPDPVRAYEVLRRALDRGGDPPAPSTPPLEIANRLVKRYPAAAYDTSRIMDLYLQDSFEGKTLDGEELLELQDRLRQARRKFRKTA